MLLLMYGCSAFSGGAEIVGEVVDAAGEPLDGVPVASQHDPRCRGETDGDGEFSLDCEPGSYTLIVGGSGYLPQTVSLSAQAEGRYDTGRHALVRIPAEDGLFALQDGRYEPLPPAYLSRRIQATAVGRVARAYCLERDASMAVSLYAGQQSILDSGTPGWRPFRLDGEGCAYREAQTERQSWQILYKERPPYAEETLRGEKGSPDRRLATMDLRPGEYFLATWEEGFFTPDPTTADRYTGYWLQVR